MSLFHLLELPLHLQNEWVCAVPKRIERACKRSPAGLTETRFATVNLVLGTDTKKLQQFPAYDKAVQLPGIEINAWHGAGAD
eukprot:884365-Amphidinium_carterae.1